MKAMLEGRCPKCEKGTIFARKGNVLAFRLPQMHEHCPSCGYKFEREPGYFLGAMYVSYGLTVFEMIVSFLLLFWWTPQWLFYVLILTILLLSSFLNYRISRIIWIHLFWK